MSGTSNPADLADAPQAQPSTYWADLQGDELGQEIVDRFRHFREWMQANGLLQGWRLLLRYVYNEYRANPEIPHLAILQQWGAEGEYSFLSLPVLRSLLRTITSSVVQNPPAYQCKATNADASALESAAVYQTVLDYYARDLRLDAKIAKAVELGMIVSQSMVLVEWDPFATNGEAPADTGIWTGAPSVTVLNPWDCAWDVMKGAWSDLDHITCRTWVSRQKVKAQFPEFADDIEGCQSRVEVMQGQALIEPSRYDMVNFPDVSDDIQVFRFFHRPTPFMPQGRFCLALENGRLIFDSPVGLQYPRLPVERFVPDECVDILLGYSPAQDLVGLAENINSLVSAISTNAANFANQFVAVPAGTSLNPKTLGEGQRVIEYPPGTNPPQGINLTSIPETLFAHLKDLMEYAQQIPGVSNASRGQAPGANSTGSAMLFLSSQTSQNQGSITQNYNDFTANVMTSLLRTLRTFARTQKTINIMGRTVASKTIVVADALKDFDEVVVDPINPLLNTPAGRLQFANQMMQWGNATPQQALQVATSGNLGPAEDPAREELFEVQLENEWLLQNESVMVLALDNHEQHIQTHTRLLATPWLRKPDLAQRMGIANAPAIMKAITDHIQQHMQYLTQSQGNTTATTAGQQPGQQQQAPSKALGHMPAASPDVGQQNPAQGEAATTGINLPAQPTAPAMPR